jgi:hypothetical protein
MDAETTRTYGVAQQIVVVRIPEIDAAVTVRGQGVAGYLVAVALVHEDAVPILRYNISSQIVVIGKSLFNTDRIIRSGIIAEFVVLGTMHHVDTNFIFKNIIIV